MNTLTFNDTHLEVVDHLGHPWLKGSEIAKALGYARVICPLQPYQR